MKQLLRRWLFASEQAKIEREYKERMQDVSNKEASLLRALESKYNALEVSLKASYDIKLKSVNEIDMFRKLMKGFNPKSISKHEGETSYADILVELEGDNESVDEFLKNVHEIYKNPAIGRIAEFIIRNQVLYSAKEATNLAELNFGRATVNGVSLFREEIDRLEGIYQERHAPEEDFDEHEVV
jgi:hypothetical protein